MGQAGLVSAFHAMSLVPPVMTAQLAQDAMKGSGTTRGSASLAIRAAKHVMAQTA
jgi:hypothetical protein